MRQNLLVALLSVCCALLAVNLYVSFSTTPLPAAVGQGTAVPTGQVAIATVQGTSNDPWCYIYDVASQRLACYVTKNMGIELKGVRQIRWDLMLEELNPALANKRLTVTQVKKEMEKGSQ